MAIGTSYYRARYYDPNSGRFLSEDPLRFYGGSNFYRYVRNNPTLLIDSTGMITLLPPHPGINTIVCNGRGGMRAQLGSPRTAKQKECYGDCDLAHENSHRADAMAAAPKICRGKAAGIIVGFSNLEEQRFGESKASNAELDCLRNKLDKGCKGSGCGPMILERIQDVEGYRRGLEKQ